MLSAGSYLPVGVVADVESIPAPPIGVPTGLTELDRALGGGHRLGEMWAIVGARNAGTTSLATQLAVAYGRSGRRTLMVNEHTPAWAIAELAASWRPSAAPSSLQLATWVPDPSRSEFGAYEWFDRTASPPEAVVLDTFSAEDGKPRLLRDEKRQYERMRLWRDWSRASSALTLLTHRAPTDERELAPTMAAWRNSATFRATLDFCDAVLVLEDGYLHLTASRTRRAWRGPVVELPGGFGTVSPS